MHDQTRPDKALALCQFKQHKVKRVKFWTLSKNKLYKKNKFKWLF